MPEPAVTISIVTWNSCSTIRGCLESILAQSFSDYEIVVVDNASRDSTCQIVHSFRDTRLRLIQLEHNAGFCGGHNRAISESSGTFVLLVNPDVVMDRDYLVRAVGVMQADEKIGSVCGLLLQADPGKPTTRIDSAGLVACVNRTFKLRLHGILLSETSLVRQEVFGADGALPLYRRTMMNDISIAEEFFDEMFFAHKEDWDISWRARLLGWKTIFEPSCIALHPRLFRPGDLVIRKHMTKEVRYHAVKNQLLLLLKNEDLRSGLRSIHRILPRQFLVFLYAVLFEWSSLRAYGTVLSNLKGILVRRREIQARRTLSPVQFRNLLVRS